VKDSGVGMSITDQRKLFKDFTTLESNAHLNPNGVGLGLSICKKITTYMDGDIWVESKPGKGSTFTFFVACDLIDEMTKEIKFGICANSASGTGGRQQASGEHNVNE
jgi:signal transduction histidine kinase